MSLVRASAAGSVTVKRSRDEDAGLIKWTYSMAGDAAADASVVVVEVGARAGRSASFEVSRDDAGVLRSIAFETVEEGGSHLRGGAEMLVDGLQPAGRHAAGSENASYSGGYGQSRDSVTVTSTTLEVAREDREQVERWLEQKGGGWLAPGTALRPVVPSTASDDPLLQLLFEKGKTSRNVYDSTSTSGGGGAGVSAGVGVGGAIEINGSSRDLRDGEFLGAPRADGTRPFLPNSACGR